MIMEKFQPTSSPLDTNIDTEGFVHTVGGSSYDVNLRSELEV